VYLECKNISKTYGSVVAIEEASLSVEKGEIRAILGGNGSGKSTLAKIIGGIVKQTTGEIYINNEKYDVNSPADAKRKKVIITSQELSLLSNLTVEENLVLPAIPKDKFIFTSKKQIREKALGILKDIGLTEKVNKKISELPANEQFLVEFAKALLQEPEILVIDEITSALFREEVELLKKIVRELSSKGCTILFISHRMAEIFSLCSSVTVMRNGRVINTYKIEDVDEDLLVEMLTGEKISPYEIKKNSADQRKAENELLLEVEKLPLKRFNKELNLQVYKGEFIGIAGLQGQGQSDLVRTLFGLDGPVDIKIEGKAIHINSLIRSVQSGIAFLSGDREKEGTFAERSILENLAVVSEGTFGKKVDKPKELLNQYKVKYDNLAQPIKNLSGGNQQKVVLARWTGTNPKILLADDPTKGIDVSARRDVHEVFNNLVLNGSTVILVSSDDEELVNISKLIPKSRVLVLYDGEISKTLVGEEITVHNIISASLPREEVH